MADDFLPVEIHRGEGRNLDLTFPVDINGGQITVEAIRPPPDGSTVFKLRNVPAGGGSSEVEETGARAATAKITPAHSAREGRSALRVTLAWPSASPPAAEVWTSELRVAG